MNLEAHFKLHSHSWAYQDSQVSWTYKDLKLHLGQLTSWLKTQGIGPNTTVALYAPNGPAHFLFLLGAVCLGYRFTPLNFKTPAREIAEIYKNQSDLLIVLTMEEDFRSLVPQCLVYKMATPSGICDPLNFRYTDVPLLTLKTSGSTGLPKVRSFTWKSLMTSALGSNTFLKLEATDRWGLMLPLYHVGGLMLFLRTFLAGAATIGLSNQDWEKGFLQQPLTALSLVPTQLIRLLRLPTSQKTEVVAALLKNGLRFILMGGDKTPQWALDEAFELKLPCLPTYGLTEMLSGVTCVPLGMKSYTSGVLLPDRELKIEQGEIWVKGPMLFYENNQEWYATGDLGELTPEGLLIVHGRKDRLFIVGGENLAPGAIEAQLLELPGVIFAHVFPTENLELGQIPEAKVLVEGPWNEESLKAALQKRLPRYQIPRKIWVFNVDTTPLPMGKIHPKDLA